MIKQDYISRYSTLDQEGLFVIGSALLFGEILSFVELANLKEQVDEMFAEEQSRLIAADLAGDYLCDGCLI